MFEYNFHEKAGLLFVVLPDELKFNINFLNAITELISKATNKRCREICVSCSEKALYDKMSKAYILNVLRSFRNTKVVKWDRNLANIIYPKIHVRDGSKFEPVDMIQTVVEDELSYYVFKDDATVSKPVNEMTKLLVEKNATLNTDEIKEFLSTTIGEIFSNCFLHSNRDEAFFMFDVWYEKEDFYLCVNIIDYGTTLINNVKTFFKKNYDEEKSSVECFEWAMKEGTTTRVGSGGYGLATLTEYVEKARGELYIFSGDAYFEQQKQNHDVRTSMGYFGGTSVTFKIKLFETSQIMTYDSSKNKLVTINLDSI